MDNKARKKEASALATLFAIGAYLTLLGMWRNLSGFSSKHSLRRILLTTLALHGVGKPHTVPLSLLPLLSYSPIFLTQALSVKQLDIGSRRKNILV